jgi:hypothetical protein
MYGCTAVGRTLLLHAGPASHLGTGRSNRDPYLGTCNPHAAGRRRPAAAAAAARLHVMCACDDCMAARRASASGPQSVVPVHRKLVRPLSRYYE